MTPLIWKIKNLYHSTRSLREAIESRAFIVFRILIHMSQFTNFVDLLEFRYRCVEMHSVYEWNRYSEHLYARMRWFSLHMFSETPWMP